jgi:Protein of unknown function (DUF3467)
MTQPQPAQPPEFKLQVPDDLTSGVYSNIMAVWHTPYEFTLDFAVMLPNEIAADDAGNQKTVIPARVVARVKIPPAQVFALMQALSTNEQLYEEGIGPIPKPGPAAPEPPLFPPEG